MREDDYLKMEVREYKNKQRIKLEKPHPNDVDGDNETKLQPIWEQ